MNSRMLPSDSFGRGAESLLVVLALHHRVLVDGHIAVRPFVYTLEQFHGRNATGSWCE